jgi:hypothetical protein
MDCDNTTLLRKGKIIESDGMKYQIEDDKENLHEIGPTAKRIWELCDGETTNNELIEELSENSIITKNEMKSSFNLIIKRLEDLDLIGAD